MGLERITIGTRGSALARKQVDCAIEMIRTVDSSVPVEVRVIQTEGDVNQQPIPLDTVGKGWFTKEIERALASGEIDLAVHSLKDMADEMPAGLCIGAYLPREDARDALVTRNGEALASLRDGAVIGTDSARRQTQMRALRPDVIMKSIRGNVATRIDKMHTEDYDAVILAAAGLKRLGLDHLITHYFDPQDMTPSPGQGIIAVQMRDEIGALQTLIKSISDTDAAHAAHIERSFSRAMGGGCKSPTGAFATHEGNECHFVGMHVDASGAIHRKEVQVPWNNSHIIGETMAHDFLQSSYHENV